MKEIHFSIEVDELTDRQRERLHILIRTELQRNTEHLVIKGLWPIPE